MGRLWSDLGPIKIFNVFFRDLGCSRSANKQRDEYCGHLHVIRRKWKVDFARTMILNFMQRVEQVLWDWAGIYYLSATSSRFSLNLQFKDCVRIVAVLGLPLLVRRTPVVTIADLRKEEKKKVPTCSTIDFKIWLNVALLTQAPKPQSR